MRKLTVSTCAALAACVAVAMVASAQNAPKRAPPSVTADNLQWDGQGAFQLFDRPTKKQGLDTLLARGRVRPEKLLVAGMKGRDEIWASERTIYRDEYTHAEVWRLTDRTSGVVHHTYSGVPAWNANGRYIMIEPITFGNHLFDQEACTLTHTGFGGEWSPTEPNILVSSGQWQGKPAVVAIDLVQGKVVRGLAPVRKYAGVSPVSADGKWVCFREGTQDDATTFGIAAIDGSSYKSIRTDGGILVEETPPDFEKPLPEQPALAVTKGGIHQMYFTRRQDHSVITNCHGADPHARIFTPDGKMIAGFENFTHQSWEPNGKYVLYMKQDILALDVWTKKESTVLVTKGTIEGHTTWNSFDPNWASLSWRSTTAGEIIRLSMRDDHSVARLCGTCPVNPDVIPYNSCEFGCMSPDGTKVMFMSSMSGSMNEYLVVAANPRPPRIAWDAATGDLAITPDVLSREVKGYRVCISSTPGGPYRDLEFAPTPASATVPYAEPIHFRIDRKINGVLAVRAQEWSGLVSRFSNEVSLTGGPVARYIEPETLDFTGFKQGFDPLGASDMYYLFVPKEGEECSVSFTNDVKGGTVWLRVGGENKKFTANGMGYTVDAGKTNRVSPYWEWIGLPFTGRITVSSKTNGFMFDRVFIAPGKESPTGIGNDYLPSKTFPAEAPADVAAKPVTPFAVEVTWKPVAGARYYNVYASDKEDFVPAQASLLYSPPVGTEKVVDWGLKPGAAYCYKVVAVDYDGNVSKAGASAAVKTPAIEPDKQEVEYESGSGAAVETDAGASGGKAVLLGKGETLTLKFTTKAEGDYVLWHQWFADDGGERRCSVKIDGGPPHVLIESYDLVALRGKLLKKEWLWSRYTFHWSIDSNAVMHLKPGEHTLTISSPAPIHLDKLVITNDQSWVPSGKLCTF